MPVRASGRSGWGKGRRSESGPASGPERACRSDRPWACAWEQSWARPRGVVVAGSGVPLDDSSGDGDEVAVAEGWRCRSFAADGAVSDSGAGAPSTSCTTRWTGSGRLRVYAAAATPLDRPTAMTTAVPPAPSRRIPRRRATTVPVRPCAARNAATYRSSPASSLGRPGRAQGADEVVVLPAARP